MDPMYHGKTVVVYEGKNDASTWINLIAKHQCTIFIGVPTIYRQVIQKTDFSLKEVPTLRHCMCAGEHLSDEVLSAWSSRFKQDIYEAIGMSECSYYISHNKSHAIRPGSAGIPQPGHDIALIDERGKPVGVNEEGMIAIPLIDPGLFIEYWGLKEETQNSRNDEFFLTGDYASQDEEGYIWFLGRKDDIINSFGYRISPHEIERVLKTHPAIADAVAVEEAVEKDKSIVTACVIFHSHIKQATSEEALISFCEAHLAQYKVPKKIVFMSVFPRTKNGKVLRKKIKQDLSS
jgi:acetyl-CoA synthetase